MTKLLSLQVGQPTDYEPTPGDTSDKPWRTAFYKRPIGGRVLAGDLGLAGDGVADRVHHGGPDKAICVYASEHYPFWQEELGLEDLSPAAFGENFTVEGFDEEGVCVGDVWRVGGATFQVSQPRQPCWKIARRWGRRELTLRVIETGYSGWYLRVLEEGEVGSGDAIDRVERPLPDWTVTRANRVMHHQKKDAGAAAELAAVELLSESWRNELRARVEKLNG